MGLTFNRPRKHEPVGDIICPECGQLQSRMTEEFGLKTCALCDSPLEVEETEEKTIDLGNGYGEVQETKRKFKIRVEGNY